MNFLIKRRQLVLATLVVALGAAVFVNWYYTGNNTTIQSPEETTENNYVQNLGEAKYVNATGESADYFSEIKLKRQKAKDEAIEKLNEALEKTREGSEEAKEITKSIDNLTKQIKLESDIEALISAKIATECVVVLNEKSAQVVVSKDELNDDTTLQIIDAVTTNTDLTADKIKITQSK